MNAHIDVLTLKGISKSYSGPGQERLEVLKDINLTIPRVCCMAILGPSGEGKSTLLNIMSMLDTPSSGDLVMNGHPIPYGSKQKLRDFRSQVSCIFQEHHLISHLTALENVAFPLICRGVQRREALLRGYRYMAALRLEDRLHHLPSELSGGQKQRVGIARAFASEARIVLADEPTGNLDRQSAQSVMEALRGLAVNTQTPVVIVTHNEELAKRYCELRYELKDGRLEELKPPPEPEVIAPVRRRKMIKIKKGKKTSRNKRRRSKS